VSDEYLNVLISSLKARSVFTETAVSPSSNLVLCKIKTNLLGLIEFTQSGVKICNVNDDAT